VAMMQLLAAGTVSNTQSTALTTANNLANNIRELTQTLAFDEPENGVTPLWGPEGGEVIGGPGTSASTPVFDDLDDLDGRTFSPPIDARRSPITAMADWAQQVTVENIDPMDLDGSPRPNGSTPMVRITVRITRGGEEVSAMSWIAVDID